MTTTTETTWCRACGGAGEFDSGEETSTCGVCDGAGEHPVDLQYGVTGTDTHPPVNYPERPEPAPLPTCGLPAVEAWAVYDYADGGPSYIQSFPFCRFHRATQRAAADRAALDRGQKASVYPANYQAGQSRVACTGDRNPAQLGEALDRERIDKGAEAVRAALRELTSLTANAFGHSFEIGNEGAVLTALYELIDDVEEQQGVVARRLAARASWARVAERGSMTRLDRPNTARRAWSEWGGGPGDEEPPTD